VNHSQWKTRRTKRLLGETVEESPSYTEAGHALALGQAVYDRRIALGISQAELARRAGMTQPQISNIEGGDSVPTIPLLTRLASALDASMTIRLDDGDSTFVFTPHPGSGPDTSAGDGHTSAA
jgi:ribosome-binding protein aMBF1 (putative translation factor)